MSSVTFRQKDPSGDRRHYDVVLHEIGRLRVINEKTRSARLRFAREKLAERFADKWRRELWASYFDHQDPIHSSTFTSSNMLK
jgi:hypothetical protein